MLFAARNAIPAGAATHDREEIANIYHSITADYSTGSSGLARRFIWKKRVYMAGAYWHHR
ncbi:hypothetical protein A5892_12325 [Halotalea alkalilenta]|uniref:Uncharacterized protein n=1 Tax=Halotalea alkalilenta TaxID=376489 RepID=A0A172YGT2_9GAMM|nr:hypothetical protein A5892_12325 [Halotalea alkalilenta]